MKFDIFCEIQRAFPWRGKDEASLFRETIAQAVAADRANFETWWQVEHHGAPEFSYSAAPDIKQKAAALIDAAGGHYVDASVMRSVPPYGLAVPMLVGGSRAVSLADRLRPYGFDLTPV